MKECSFYFDDRVPVNRSACSTHGDRHPIGCAKELQAENTKLLAGVERLNENRVAISDRLEKALEERDAALLQLGEAKLALEIALPGMVHTFSGHEYVDGKPVEFVDGCGKCRAMKVLSHP